MFDPLWFLRRSNTVADEIVTVVETAPSVAAQDAKLKASFPNIDPATLRTIIDEVFAVALAATSSRPIMHMMLMAAQSIVDQLLPKVAANLQAKGVKVG